MGLFGGLGKALKYYATPEGIQTVGATLKDISDGGSENFMALQQRNQQLAQLRQKQAAGLAVQGLFGGTGGAPMADGGGISTSSRLPSLSDPAIQQKLLVAQQAGYDIRPVIDMLKAGQPDIAFAPDGTAISKNDPGQVGKRFAQPDVVNGLVIDKGDPNNRERYIPQLGEGMTYSRDASGRATSVQNAPGYVDALGQATEGKQLGQTRGTMLQVPRQAGGTAMMTGGQFLDGGQQTPGLGLSQTPAEAAAANITSTAQAGAQVNLPQSLQTADQALKAIADLKNDPSLKMRTGLLGALPAIPGTPGADFDARVQQIKGKVFLDAYNALKGAGQITEIEGKKAEAATARLSTTQTEAGFKAALDDLASVIEAGKQRATTQAGQPAQARGGRSQISQADAIAELRRRGKWPGQ